MFFYRITLQPRIPHHKVIRLHIHRPDLTGDFFTGFAGESMLVGRVENPFGIAVDPDTFENTTVTAKGDFDV